MEKFLVNINYLTTYTHSHVCIYATCLQQHKEENKYTSWKQPKCSLIKDALIVP